MPHSNKKLNLIGLVFGRLTVIEQAHSDTRTKWKCRCFCGQECIVSTNKLRRGHTKSCGCLKRTQKAALSHGYCANGKVSSEYWAWHNAKRRCTEPDRHNFHRYGGRGILMCEEWRNDFQAFIAHIGPKPPGHTLDRIDNNRGYEPGNVRWATPSQQAKNRKNHKPWRISEADSAFIKKHYIPFDKNFGMRALARKFGVDHASVKRALVRPSPANSL